MSVTGAIALYFIIWWTVLFAILPFGVRSQSEEGQVTAGTEPGAPIAPRMMKKAFWTTLIAAIVFGFVVLALNYIEL